MNLLLICFCVLFSNVRTQTNNNVEDFIKVITKVLEEIAKMTPLDPDSFLSISEIVEKYGYPFEEHNITTEDDYILPLHRIKHGKDKSDSDTPGPVVFIHHGLVSSSMIYVNSGPDKSLGMLFADAGYDVWLGNTRGNQYSTHKTLTPKDAAYWDFSFHEKAVYDLRASIDYVIKSTGHDQITYIGHSEGTTEGLILTSTKPEYNDKLNLMVLLSPVAYMDGLTSPIPRLLAENMNILKLLLEFLNIRGLAYSPLVSALAKVVCNDASSLQPVCVAMVEFLVGFDINQMNRTRLPVIANGMPSGLSFKELYHYGQEINTGYFRQYDYGAIVNIIKYGSTTPPSYDVKKITCPVASYYAKNDFFAAVSDVEKLLHELPNKATSNLIESESFNHLDFVYANDVKEIIFDKLIKVVNKYNPLN